MGIIAQMAPSFLAITERLLTAIRTTTGVHAATTTLTRAKLEQLILTTHTETLIASRDTTIRTVRKLGAASIPLGPR